MAATMKDIARDLGVSVVTVSKVLRNHSDIGANTRKRVLERVKELNYQPNPAARALVTGRTNLVGLIVPDLVHPFFAQVAKGLSAKLRSLEYSLVISSSEDDPSLEKQEIDQMLGRRVDVANIKAPFAFWKSGRGRGRLRKRLSNMSARTTTSTSSTGPKIYRTNTNLSFFCSAASLTSNCSRKCFSDQLNGIFPI